MKTFRFALYMVVLFLLAGGPAVQANDRLTAPTKPSLPALQVKGTSFVDRSGKIVLLKGCNLGNWLINEFWMFGVGGRPNIPGDQYTLEQVLTRRFGAAENSRLMDTFRSYWMTERDWDNIRTFGFNLVRVPFNYRLLEDDTRPKQLRPDAWRWLDEAVNEAEKHGLYIILDLHGVQGGQTPNDHTGRSGQNKLWSVPENQERMAWLWTKIAARYRNRNAVIAYDPMNEPYGGAKEQVVEVFQKVYTAIRSADPDKLIFAPGHYDNFDHYGNPRDHGWKNVGFQMHYYPGLFGDAPRIKSNLRHLNSLRAVAEKTRKLRVPFLVGEMNVVLKSNGGASMMRRFFDAHAGYGWLTTLWSYKVITNDGGTGDGSWGMFTNAQPALSVDFENAPKSEIEAYFRSFATQKLMPYEELREALTAVHPVLSPIPDEEMPRSRAPKEETLTGWTATDINNALPGGLVVKEKGEFDLYGGGSDIWGSSDQFRFLQATTTGDFVLHVTVVAVESTARYTKAGLMVRTSLEPDSPTVVLSVFPNGDTEVGIRETKGGEMMGISGPKAVLPAVQFSVVRKGDTLILSVNEKEILRRSFLAFTGQVAVGAIALSHDNRELTRVTYRDLGLTAAR